MDRERSLARAYAIIALDNCVLLGAIPKWATWVAKDIDNSWFAYSEKPRLSREYAVYELIKPSLGNNYIRLTNSSHSFGASPVLYEI